MNHYESQVESDVDPESISGLFSDESIDTRKKLTAVW